MRSFALIWIWLVISWPLVALDTSKPLTSYQRQNWQTESGLPQNTVHAILETQDGYLWLATEGGLVRFDGLKFTVYDSQNTPALHSNNIRALLEDREHALWIATSEGLTVFRAGRNQVFAREQGLPSNSIWSVQQDAAGQISVLTASGPAEYHDGRFAAHQIKDTVEGANGGPVTLRDSHGALWVADHGVKRTVNGKTETFPASDPLSHDVILSLFEDREGNVWLGSESNGLTVLRDQKITTYTEDLTRCVYQDQARGSLVWDEQWAHEVGRREHQASDSRGRLVEQPRFCAG
jgi:hypothetical protein